MKKRFLTWCIMLIFLIWILPLGAFIKPEMEAKACNGQRAICLCSKLLAKQIAKNAGRLLLKSPSQSVQKENAAANSHDFLPYQPKLHAKNKIIAIFYDNTFLYSLLITKKIDHIPKINLSHV